MNRNSFNEGRRSLDRFLHAILWTMLSADEGHFLSAIGGQNPSAQATTKGAVFPVGSDKTGHL
ncbi:MAG: hypothetical protein GX625_02810 [Clostridiaceae bacterium]|nr:hypothetical protein [Clostridiaceae bacterium]